MNPFDGSVYVVLKDEVPVGAARYYGSALSIAGDLGTTGIHRISEGVWEGTTDGGATLVRIYRMGVRA